MKIDLNVMGAFIIVCAIFNTIAAWAYNWFANFLVVWYSIGWVIIYFIVINCDIQWKKKKKE